MQAAVFEIQSKRKAGELSIASLDDFSLLAHGTVDARLVLERPQITLYCLDDKHRRAVFVETPPEVDLTRHAFYYRAQYDYAQRVLAVSYDSLNQLAAKVDSRNLRPILIYSVGRCGSTLLSRALGCLDEVRSLSEPDVYAQIADMRPKDGSRDGELIQLIRSCTSLLGRTNSGQAGTLAIKFRSFSIAIGDLFHTAFPLAKTLFLYRNAETWASSTARAMSILDGSATAANLGISPLMMLTIMWVSVMDRYLDLYAQGVPMLAVRYETLTSFPEPALRTIFEYCDLPLNQVSAAQRAFAEDSQEGSALSRDRVQASRFVLTADHRLQIKQVLREHSRIQNAEFIVPNTVTVEQGT
jgi:hypothetical protein